MRKAEPTGRDKALAQALELTRAELAGADLASRCLGLGLELPRAGRLSLGFFNQAFELDLDSLAFAPEPDPVRRILMLRYLRRVDPLPMDGDPVAYRELPGAAFYVGPFRARTVIPLAAKMGSNLAGLAQPMAALNARPADLGDASWRVPVLGAVWMLLVCQAPDEEFEASCELLFSPAVPRVYSPDEAAMLGSLLCRDLMRALPD